jgi:pimeloyl-ACP methyl ester carboxylesterase
VCLRHINDEEAVMGKKVIVTVICALLIVGMGSLPALGADEGPDSYTAVTADGARLAMKRYRPDSTARFNKRAQPIILMPAFSANFNEFDVHTPEGENYQVKLPSPLATWARGDKYIQKDHMRYYSIAHYLWRQGYDIWLVNYRGQGRTPYRSTGAWGYNLDDLGIFDTPAAVEKVYSITRKHPIWLGHSTGTTMAYIYLQGAKYGPGPNPHVVSDPVLAKLRNGGDSPQSIKGLVDLDGPMVVFNGKLLDNFLIWSALSVPAYLDIRGLLRQFGDNISDPALYLSRLLWYTCKNLGIQDLGPLGILVCLNKDNMDPAVGNFGTKYCFDGMSTRTVAQFCDAAAHGIFREDFANGKWCVAPPDPRQGDGYYCYSDNLPKIKVPALVIADSRADLTNPEDIKSFYLKKTRDRLDSFVQMRKAAHCDMALGFTGPSFLYPTVGSWLKRLCRR